ncbi:MAG: dadA [Acidobacteria bacterium]|nr:dadA [Acidobacteriota bacterium]
MSLHVLIVGGGIIGLCTAHFAAQRGHRVTLLERGPASRDGCSFGNGGMVVPSHFVPLAAPGMVRLGLKWMWNPESPFYIKPRLSWGLLDWGWKFTRAATARHVNRSAPLLRDLHVASRACFEELADETGNEFGLVKRGLLMLCKTRRAFDEEAHVAELGRRLGVPSEILTPSAISSLEPNLRMDVAGAVYFPDDCHLVPAALMASLTRRLTEAGVQFAWNTVVTGWRTGGNLIHAVRTTGGDFDADEYVVCGGAWSPALVRSLGLRLPMQAGKGYSLTLPQPRRLPSVCAILSEARVAVTPMGSTLRFAGTMEISGLNQEIHRRRVQGIIKSVPQYFPEYQPADFLRIQPWCGLRPCSPDGLPYVGRFGRFANLSVASGHAMMGVSLGPVTGKLMAEMLSGEEPSLAIEQLSPSRYN